MISRKKRLLTLIAFGAVGSLTADDWNYGRFREPLAVDCPQTWFHVIGGNISKLGITADLEALKFAGVGGIQFFHGQFGKAFAWPRTHEQVPCLSEKWGEYVGFIGNECERLGLKFEMQNCPGWSMSGGPWIGHDKAMRGLVCFVRGKEPKFGSDDDYHEIGEVAFPRPLGWGTPASIPQTIVTNGDERVFDFGKAVTIRTLHLPPHRDITHHFAYEKNIRVIFEAEVGSRWQRVLDREYPRGCWQDDMPVSFACGDVSARRWRLNLVKRHPFEKNVLGFVRFSSVSQLDGWDALGGWAYHELPPRGTAANRYRTEPGEARLVFGHVNLKKKNAPAPLEATGWECDKLDPAGFKANFDAYLGRLAKGVLAGGKLKGLVVDSWECGRQSWTWKMEEYFRQINGYELRPNLPTLFGYPAGRPEDAEKFLLDWRRTISRLVEDNYYRVIAELGHEHGMTVQFETAFADVIPGDNLRYWKYADIPMCEFWSPFDNAKGGVGSDNFKSVRSCVSAAHIYGKSRVQAEAFTTTALTWNENLRELKPIADRHFARGVTHLVFHTYTHNPQTGKDFLPPGTSFGTFIGVPFIRGQTWWGTMPEFTKYLARCGAMLERGKPVVDVLWYFGDDFPYRPDENAPFPEGYKYDYCNFDALSTRASVKDGRIVFPDGMSYRVLWIPEGTFLLPETEALLVRLEREGARIVRGELRPDWPSELEKLGSRPKQWYQRRDGKEDIFFVVGEDGATSFVTIKEGRRTVYDPLTGEVQADWKSRRIPRAVKPVELKPVENYVAWATNRVYSGVVEAQSGAAVLSLGRVFEVAEVFVNGAHAATLWCEPYECEIGRWLKPSKNELRVEVTTTVYNLLAHEAALPESARTTWALATPKAQSAMKSAGLLGPVTIKAQ